MSMTRKDYEMLARVIGKHYGNSSRNCSYTIEALINELVERFEADNAKFNGIKFWQEILRW